MRKISVIILIALVMAGCNKKTTWSPTIPASTLVISAQISRQESSASLGQTVYDVMLIDSGTMAGISGAEVTVTGPTGIVTVPENAAGIYGLQLLGADVATYYQFNQTYTVDITIGGKTYTASSVAPGNITIAADGSLVTWTVEGNSDIISAMAPDSSMVSIPPSGSGNANSPANITGTGILSKGAGSYMVQATIINQFTNAFSGANVGSALVVMNQKTLYFTK